LRRDLDLATREQRVEGVPADSALAMAQRGEQELGRARAGGPTRPR
jgi:hypothetical protein